MIVIFIENDAFKHQQQNPEEDNLFLHQAVTGAVRTSFPRVVPDSNC